MRSAFCRGVQYNIYSFLVPRPRRDQSVSFVSVTLRRCNEFDGLEESCSYNHGQKSGENCTFMALSIRQTRILLHLPNLDPPPPPTNF